MWIYLHLLLATWTSCCTSVTGEHHAICSSQALLAKVGDDVTLLCHIKPPVNATKVTMVWLRPDLKPDYVHILQDGHDINRHKNPLYKMRTSLFADELPHGNISLKLYRVQLSDEGTFQCSVPYLESSCLIQLRAGAVSQPGISLIGPNDDGLSLTCDSGCWYPQPEVSWLDSEGKNITAEPSVTVRRSQHCYVLQRNVTVRQAGRVTCRVHLPHINHTSEAHDDIPEGIIETRATGRTNSTVAGLSAGIAIAAILVAAIVGYFCCKRKKQPEYTTASVTCPGEENEYNLDLENAVLVSNPSKQTVAPSGGSSDEDASSKQMEMGSLASPQAYLKIPLRSSSFKDAITLRRSSSLKDSNRVRRSSSQRNATTNSQPLLHRNSSLREARSLNLRVKGKGSNLSFEAIRQEIAVEDSETTGSNSKCEQGARPAEDKERRQDGSGQKKDKA